VYREVSDKYSGAEGQSSRYRVSTSSLSQDQLEFKVTGPEIVFQRGSKGGGFCGRILTCQLTLTQY